MRHRLPLLLTLTTALCLACGDDGASDDTGGGTTGASSNQTSASNTTSASNSTAGTSNMTTGGTTGGTSTTGDTTATTGGTTATTGGMTSTTGGTTGGTTSTSGGGQPDAVTLYGPTITEVIVEIDYATGAAPYTGANLWDMFGVNAQRMFEAGVEKTITYPDALDQMEELTDIDGDSFDAQAIFDIALEHRDQLSDGATATFYVVWLDGFYEDESGVRENVLGITLGSTGVIGIFKPVIEAIPGGLLMPEAARRAAEQATLIHEFGHAAGLVNVGVPLTSDHHDEEHGAHCSNTDCIMYYANEVGSGIGDFVGLFGGEPDPRILFGDACLADMDALGGE